MPEPPTPEAVAHELLADGIRALAHESSVVASLDTILGAVSERLRIASAVVVVRDPALESLVVVASVGLLEPALTGLTQAMAAPGHPIARPLAAPAATFDVLPTVPGGPALRSHLPLSVDREGSESVLGVLALAYQEPLDDATRALLVAVGDLAALALERLAAG